MAMELKNKTNKLIYEKQQILNDIKTILLDMPNRNANISKYGIKVRGGRSKVHSLSLLGVGKRLAVTTTNFDTYSFESFVSQVKDYRDILEVLEDVQKPVVEHIEKLA